MMPWEKHRHVIYQSKEEKSSNLEYLLCSQVLMILAKNKVIFNREKCPVLFARPHVDHPLRHYSLPTVMYLGGALVYVGVGYRSPSLEKQTTGSIIYHYSTVLYSVVLHAGVSGTPSSCPQSPRHAQDLLSTCIAVSAAIAFCKIVPNKREFSLSLAIRACNSFSLDCHFLFARLPFTLIPHDKEGALVSSILAKRQVCRF